MTYSIYICSFYYFGVIMYSKAFHLFLFHHSIFHMCVESNVLFTGSNTCTRSLYFLNQCIHENSWTASAPELTLDIMGSLRFGMLYVLYVVSWYASRSTWQLSRYLITFHSVPECTASVNAASPNRLIMVLWSPAILSYLNGCFDSFFLFSVFFCHSLSVTLEF